VEADEATQTAIGTEGNVVNGAGALLVNQLVLMQVN
jgi:hypothetical protein